MEEIKIQTHLIISDIHEEYEMKWCGKIMNAKPLLKNGMPVFSIVGTGGRMEINTVDMTRLERAAKLLTRPKGRSAVSKDSAYIYIKEIDGHEMLLGIMTHKNIKTFVPMYDKVGFVK